MVVRKGVGQLVTLSQESETEQSLLARCPLSSRPLRGGLAPGQRVESGSLSSVTSVFPVTQIPVLLRLHTHKEKL